jgi:hypothetical protein
MIEIKNLLFQPLALHRRDGTGLHLGPRGRAAVEDDAVSEEMRRAEARGVVSMAPVEGVGRHESPGTAVPAPVPPADPPTAEDPAHPRRKKDK